MKQNCHLREESERRLVFRRFPYILWLVGSIIDIAGIYLIYHLAIGEASGGRIFEGFDKG